MMRRRSVGVFVVVVVVVGVVVVVVVVVVAVVAKGPGGSLVPSRAPFGALLGYLGATR